MGSGRNGIQVISLSSADWKEIAEYCTKHDAQCRNFGELILELLDFQARDWNGHPEFNLDIFCHAWQCEIIKKAQTAAKRHTARKVAAAKAATEKAGTDLMMELRSQGTGHSSTDPKPVKPEPGELGKLNSDGIEGYQ